MELDPKTSMIINIAVLVLSSFSMAGWWTDLVGAHIAGIVTGVMLSLVTAGNAVLHAYSPPQPGPLTTPTKPG